MNLNKSTSNCSISKAERESYQYDLVYNALKRITNPMTTNNELTLDKKIDTVFTPANPVETSRLFAGRSKQMETIKEAFLEKGCHLIVYGDRGVGKTSIANVTKEVYGNLDPSIICIKITCDPEETFENIWREMLKQILIIRDKKQFVAFHENPIEKENIELSNFVSKENGDSDATPSKILNLLNLACPNMKCLFIFDEFDGIQKEEVKRRFTHLMKHISDNSGNLTIMLVGVAENIEDILKSHQSVERCLHQIPLPRMSKEEIGDIIKRGLDNLELQMDDDVKNKIIRFSEGFPQYTHLFCKYTTKYAVNDNRLNANLEDFKNSLNTILEKFDESTKRSYQKATINDRQNIYEKVIAACALVDVDDYNTFNHTDLKTTMFLAFKDKRNSYLEFLKQLCTENKGSILKKKRNSNTL